MSSRCAACPGVHKCLGPTGPMRTGEPLWIAEAPGATEEAEGRILAGPTGQEVDEHYLPLVGKRRQNCAFVNAIACLPESNGGKIQWSKPKDRELLRICSAHNLIPLIERLQPSMLIPMGRFACEAVAPGAIDLEIEHGLPTFSDLFQLPVFPMYHPALGMHEPKKMLYIRNDWLTLKKYLAGTLQVRVDPYAEVDYAEVTDPDEVRYGLIPTMPIGMDTESSPGVAGPYCVTYSQFEGTGRLIRAERRDLLKVLAEVLGRWRSKILFHNLPYDWPVMEEMGVPLPARRLLDTMVLIHNLGNLPQGLKAIARRYLGMLMQDFEDVVVPYSRARVLDYYELAASFDWVKPDPQMVRDEDGRWKVYNEQSMSTKLKRFFTDYGKNPDKDVFKMWEENWVGNHAEIEEKCGPWPNKDIRHVPFEQALFYACRDSDATLRALPFLLRISRLVRKYGQEEWIERAEAA